MNCLFNKTSPTTNIISPTNPCASNEEPNARLQRAKTCNPASVPAQAAQPNTTGHKCRCTAPLDKANLTPTHRFSSFRFTTPADAHSHKHDICKTQVLVFFFPLLIA